MIKLKIAFFGTPQYSLIILKTLFNSGYPIACVITKPPQMIGRKQILTPTPVAVWAKNHQIPVITPDSDKQKPWIYANESKLVDEVISFNPDLIVTADYAMRIPQSLIIKIKYGGLNIHPSLLPNFRGPAPIPWAILKGENQTGVSIVTLTHKFDQGKIIAQEKIPILNTDTTPILMEKLFNLGAKLLIKILPNYFSRQTIKQYSNLTISPSYFPRLSRNDGFIPWEFLRAVITNTSISKSLVKKYNDLTIINSNKLGIGNWALVIERAWRAFLPWPGLWTEVKINGQNKRLKILQAGLKIVNNDQKQLILESIQLEGKNLITGNSIKQLMKNID